MKPDASYLNINTVEWEDGCNLSSQSSESGIGKCGEQYQVVCEIHPLLNPNFQFCILRNNELLGHFLHKWEAIKFAEECAAFEISYQKGISRLTSVQLIAASDYAQKVHQNELDYVREERNLTPQQAQISSQTISGFSDSIAKFNKAFLFRGISASNPVLH